MQMLDKARAGQRPPLPPDPRADQRPGSHPRRDREPTIDHRGPEFAAIARDVLSQIRSIFKTEQPVIIYPSSGTGAWEAALVNTLSPGDPVLMAETGHFATLWRDMAERLGLRPEFIPGDWRHGADPEAIEARLAEDRSHASRRSASCTTRPRPGSRRGSQESARRSTGRPPGPAHGRHDLVARVDRLSPRRMGRRRHGRRLAERPDAAARARLQRGQREGAGGQRDARLPRSFWDWQPMLPANAKGFFPYTPATNLLCGLREAIAMLHEEGLDNVFARHARHGEATRQAARAWGLEIQCADPREYSNSLTAVVMPEGHSADGLRAHILERFNLSLGNGLVEAERPGVPHRPSRRLQRRDAGRHPVGGRDGAARARRRPGRQRRGGGARLLSRTNLRPSEARAASKEA